MIILGLQADLSYYFKKYNGSNLSGNFLKKKKCPAFDQ